jgi:cytochrome c-type biogenesis protein CcmE
MSVKQYFRGDWMKNYIKYAAAFAVVVLALLYLVLSGLKGDRIYYLEVSELLAAEGAELAKGLRVAGFVTDNIDSIDRMNKFAKFEISDTAPHAQDQDKAAFITCEYYGAIPDAFEEGASVVVEGRYDPAQKLFTANKLLAKCPSKYEVDNSSFVSVHEGLPRVRTKGVTSQPENTVAAVEGGR